MVFMISTFEVLGTVLVAVMQNQNFVNFVETEPFITACGAFHNRVRISILFAKTVPT